MTSSSPHPRTVWLLAPILIIGAFLRFYDLAHASLWMDEIWSIEMSIGRGSVHDHLPTAAIQTTPTNLTSLENAPPWWHIWNSLQGVTTAPIYIVLLRWWMDLLGNGPAATRALSAIFSLAAVIVFFDLCTLLHGPRIALIAAAIMAVSPAQIDFAQETRNYSLLILLCLCAADALVRLQKLGANRRRSFALAVSLTSAALTHYFAIGAIAAMAIYAAVIKLRSAIKPFLLAAVAGGLLWGWEFFQQIHSLPAGRPGFLYSDDPHHAQQSALHLIGLCGQWLAGQTYAELLPPAVMVLLTLLAIAWPAIRLPWRKDALLWLIWIAATAGPLAVSDIFRHSTFLDYLRYTILASPAVYALLASIDWPPRAVIRDTIGFCAFALAAFCANQRLREGAPSREDWRALAAQLDHDAGPDELLVFCGNDPWASPGTWYMGFTYYAPQSHRPWLILRHSADAELMRQVDTHHSLWLIGRNPSMDGPVLLPGWQPTTGLVTTAGAAVRMIQAQSSNP